MKNEKFLVSNACIRLRIMDQWFWQNFIISICGIKGNENLRIINEKSLRGFVHFCFCSQKVPFIVPSKRLNLFFFKYGEWGIKKSVISYWFPKCKFYLSKKCTEKRFCYKTVSSIKSVFGQNFLGALFTKAVHATTKYFQWFFINSSQIIIDIMPDIWA